LVTKSRKRQIKKAEKSGRKSRVLYSATAANRRTWMAKTPIFAAIVKPGFVSKNQLP